MERFDYKNISFLVDRVKDMWAPPDAEESYRRVYAEAVIRLDMHDNDMQFQMMENNQLMAIACASNKGDRIREGQWWFDRYQELSSSQQKSFRLSHDYLSMMDEKAYGFMGKEDVKLDLFISTQKGWGKKILDKAMEVFRKRGFKNLYLWTDCECNVDWYYSHGYELIDESVYAPFSREGFEYKTYIFKKTIC